MIPDETLQRLAEPFALRMQDLNTEIIAIIARRVNQIGKLSATDVHRLEQMAKHGADMREINRLIAEATNLSVKQVRQLYYDIGADLYMDSKGYFDYTQTPFIPFDENERLRSIVEAMSKQTAETFNNLSGSMGFAIKDPITELRVFTGYEQTYRQIIDRSVQSVSMGYTDYSSQIAKDINMIVSSGIKVVTYVSDKGRATAVNVDTVVRRNVLDAIRQVNQGIQDEVGRQFGATGKEISVHMHPAPDHAGIQGGQYTNEAYEALNDSLARRIGINNCRHFSYSIIIGVSQPAYSKEQLKKILVDNAKGYTDRYGKRYTLYEASQLQRKYENSIRKEKDRQMAMRRMGEDAKAMKAQAKITDLTARYNRLSRESGLSNQLAYRARKTGYRPIKVRPIT